MSDRLLSSESMSQPSEAWEEAGADSRPDASVKLPSSNHQPVERQLTAKETFFMLLMPISAACSYTLLFLQPVWFMLYVSAFYWLWSVRNMLIQSAGSLVRLNRKWPKIDGGVRE